MRKIRITTGTYNCKDWRVVKEYKSRKSALKFLQTCRLLCVRRGIEAETNLLTINKIEMTEQNLTEETPLASKQVVSSSYTVAKIEKGTERIVGFLSKGKRRWLPPLSTKQRFEADKELADKQLNLLKSKYDWQTTAHNYYYKLFVCGA